MKVIFNIVVQPVAKGEMHRVAVVSCSAELYLDKSAYCPIHVALSLDEEIIKALTSRCAISARRNQA